MTSETDEAVRIADKHLAGKSAFDRMALAIDIQQAIIRQAGAVAAEAIKEAFENARAGRSSTNQD